jgi:prepilin-type N-terminal cleavage/methylation domain-containing protein
MHKRFFRGFTVVELLIVISVIGILAGIALVSYKGSQTRANDVAVKDDLVKLSDALNVYYGDNGTYPADQTALSTISSVKLAKSNYKTSGNSVLYCTSSISGYKFMAVIAKSASGNTFDIHEDAPLENYAYGTFPGGSPGADCANLGFSSATTVWIHSTASGWMSNF